MPGLISLFNSYYYYHLLLTNLISMIIKSYLTIAPLLLEIIILFII